MSFLINGENSLLSYDQEGIYLMTIWKNTSLKLFHKMNLPSRHHSSYTIAEDSGYVTFKIEGKVCRHYQP
jgi:hypothetical protein